MFIIIIKIIFIKLQNSWKIQKVSIMADAKKEKIIGIDLDD